MNTAFVKVWGELAGAVAWNEKTGVASFEYDANFKKLNWELSPIKMPVSSGRSVFAFPELKANLFSEFNTFKGLPGLLADVLPDKYGNRLINMWLARMGREQDSLNPVELLCFIGTRGMGAMEFEPAKFSEGRSAFTIELESLVNIAQKILNNRMSFKTKLNESDEHAMMDIFRTGVSAGGARPKAVIAYNEKTGEVKSGQTLAPKGFEHWLIKLDGVSDIQLGASQGYGRVEMAYYNMATACGIEMMPCKLLEENGRAHFMTKRFDREDGDVKHHIQTFCALKHFDFNQVNSFSYEQLFQTLRELKLDYSVAEQLFRRMVFNVIARNCDDHTKNFSFRLKKGSNWELAPAYDMCHAYKPDHKWVNQHALSINGKRTGISKEDLSVIGKSERTKNAVHIIQEISETVGHWKKYADEVNVLPAIRDEIDKTLILF